jgi:hypothetical protein
MADRDLRRSDVIGRDRATVKRTDTNSPRLLIVTRNLVTLRSHFEDVITTLGRAGVDISIHYRYTTYLGPDEYRETLLRRGCEVTLTPLAKERRVTRDRLGLRLRYLANALRFYHEDYRGRANLRESKLEKAARTGAGPAVATWARRLGRLGSSTAQASIRLAAAVDRLLPPEASTSARVAEERPSAVVAVDLIRTPSFADVLKAAAWEGIPTASWIQSWDNLTTKGLLHFVPDRVFVWNTVQRDELTRYHGIPAQHVCVTGAQTFDHWFDGSEPSDRSEFCARNGLDPERPIILYLASAQQAEEAPQDFFLPWLEALRSSADEVLERANVLLRPPPTNMKPWAEFDAPPGVSMSPGNTEAPISSPEFRQRFRDELYHSSVAVALNTTAMIDAAIFGKPVCTVELPELAKGQQGYVHYGYLTSFAGGLLRRSSSLDEHVRMLAELARRPPYDRDPTSERFVSAFVRPHGRDVAPATVFTEEMFRLLESPTEVRLPGRVGQATGRSLHLSAPAFVALLEEGPARRWWRRRARRRLQKFSRRSERRLRVVFKPVRRFFVVRVPAAMRARSRAGRAAT